MSAQIPDLPWYGSFQRGMRYSSENPLEEVWSKVSYFGTTDFVKALTPERVGIDWDRHVQYACVRIQQSLELRASGAGASVVTKPITLYYSFLNLLRAFIAVGPEVIGTYGHGLRYKGNTELLQNEAQFDKGTFTEYLDSVGVPWNSQTRISLRSALSRIPEISDEFREGRHGQPNAIPVAVKTERRSNSLRLHFIEQFIDRNTFGNVWAQEFPTLSSRFELEDTGAILRLKKEQSISDYEAICALCSETMLNPLVWSDNPVWYVIRRETGEPELPRIAYYMISLFILGSVARYQPELLQPLLTPASGLGWFVNRFLRTTERFLPQLMMSWMHRSDIYFTTY